MWLLNCEGQTDTHANRKGKAIVMNNAIIVLNAGSSSIEFSLFIERKDTLEPDVRGQIEGLLHAGPFCFKRSSGGPQGCNGYGKRNRHGDP
jgi:hypothetical protein